MATGAPATIHQFDGFLLDLNRGVLVVDGVERALRPKSFSLLRHFVENADRLIDRDEIMQAVWPGVFVTDDSIAQCVAEIRRVLGDSQRQLLRTVPRRGYLFSAQRQPVADPPSPPDLRLPDKPSIAVLPFQNMSGDPEQNYFADGMVDEIVTALARFPSLFVIASGSSFTYRERERDFRRIGRELGVRYLLQGSVRRSGLRVRVSVDLVEAEAGAQMWSDRFEASLEDVFALQDEVANAVAARIEPTVQAADLRRGADRPTADLGAYDLFLRAQQLYRGFDDARSQAAIVLLDQAVARDPSFAAAWALLAYLHTGNLLAGWAADRAESARKAEEAIRQAMLANENDAVALAVVAYANVILGGDRRSALAACDRALALNPGSFACLMYAGLTSTMCGRHVEAIERCQRALGLNPRAPDRFLALLGIGRALVQLGRFEDAVSWLNQALTVRPNAVAAMSNLAIALAHLGRIDEAKAALADFDVKSWIETANIRGGMTDIYTSALKRLGVNV